MTTNQKRDELNMKRRDDMDRILVRKSALAACLTAALLGFSTGCDWSSGGSVDDANSSSIDLSVAGVYRAPDGGTIVSDFVVVQGKDGTAGSTNEVSVSGETVATGNGTSTAFGGALDHSPITPGSVTISAPPAFTLTDPDGDGTFTGTSGSSGTINYSTGAFTLNFGGAAIDSGSKITASYTFLEVSEGTDATADSRNSGASGEKIYSFNVEQNGNTIRITDNNGNTYDGKLGSSQVVSQQQVSDTQQQLQEVIQYSAEGLAGGTKVKLVGAFNSATTVFFSQNIQVNQDGSGTLKTEETFRTFSLSIDGTWVEENGTTGDISAIGPQNEKVETL